jgi:hypothetical protein
MGEGASGMSSERWVVGPGETRAAWSESEPTSHEAAQIESDIVRTRREMSGTIDELQRRLDPERFKEQVRSQVREATIGRAEHMVADVKDSARSVRAGVLDTIRENPIPAAMAAIGIGWLFMNGGSRSPSYGNGSRYMGYQAGRYRPDEGRDWRAPVGEAAERVQETAAEVQERAARAVDDVQYRAKSTLDEAQQRAAEWTDQAGNVVSNAQFEAMRTRYRVEGMMRSNPLAAGAVALAAGVVVGLALPETEPEHRLMGDARDSFMERAGSVAKEAVEKVGHVAGAATDAAQDAVAGVKPEDAVGRLENIAEKAEKSKSQSPTI